MAGCDRSGVDVGVDRTLKSVIKNAGTKTASADVSKSVVLSVSRVRSQMSRKVTV